MTLGKQMKDWLDGNEFTYLEKEKNAIFTMGIEGKNTKTWSLVVHILKEHEQILVFSIFPKEIEEKSRLNMVRFITDKNFGLRYGNFEMNFDDGILRYKTVLDVKELAPESITDAMLHSLIYSNISTFDDHYRFIDEMPATDGI